MQIKVSFKYNDGTEVWYGDLGLWQPAGPLGAWGDLIEVQYDTVELKRCNLTVPYSAFDFALPRTTATGQPVYQYELGLIVSIVIDGKAMPQTSWTRFQLQWKDGHWLP